MRRVGMCTKTAALLAFSAVIFSAGMSFAEPGQPSREEVADYIKLLDAKIVFNRAQDNAAMVRELQSEKQRTIKLWNAIKSGLVTSSGQVMPSTRQDVRDYLQKVDAQIASYRSKKDNAKARSLQAEKKKVLNHWSYVQMTRSPISKLPVTRDQVRAYLQNVDPQISSYRQQGNAVKVKQLKAEKQKVLKNWQAIQRRQARPATRVARPAARTARPAARPAAPAAPAAVRAPAEPVLLEAGMNTWLNNGHSAIRVINAELKDTDPMGQRPPEGTRFFVVTLELKNKDPFTAVYGGDYHRVMIIDASRIFYMENTAKNPGNWANNDGLKELMPEESMRTAYVFTIPAEAVPDRFVFDAAPADKYPVMRVSLR